MIYPIRLSEGQVKNLIDTHCAHEFNDACRFIYGHMEYEFHGSVQENGDVEVWVWHRFDNGFAMGGGKMFSKTLRPFDENSLKRLELREMIRLATVEFDKRRSEEEMNQILAIAKEMFGDKFAVVEKED